LGANTSTARQLCRFGLASGIFFYSARSAPPFRLLAPDQTLVYKNDGIAFSRTTVIRRSG
jgi:hypothetical protein